MTTDHSEFEARVKSNLDESVRAIDRETQAALASMRQKALEEQDKSKLNIISRIWRSVHKSSQNASTWLPASAFALCALFTVLWIYNPNSIDEPTHFVATQQNNPYARDEQITMLELLTTPEDMETATDPDFYVWVEEILATEDIDNAV